MLHNTKQPIDYFLSYLDSVDLRSGRESSQKQTIGNSPVVQWLGLSTFTVGACVQSLVGELRAHMLHSAAERKKKKEPEHMYNNPFIKSVWYDI